MKILLAFLFSLFITIANAQNQLPESSFNNWTTASGGFDEPSGGWWTTLNSLKNLGAPITVSKTTDAHSGAYAAKLETKQWGSFLLSGLLVSGKFVMVSPFVIQGKPFTDKPAKFKGWYKYTSVNGDSAAIYAMISKYNTLSGKRDTIAVAKMAVKNSVSAYTAFNLDFNYSIPGFNPDSIFVVFSSSVEGGNFLGQVGSTLFIDDLMLEYSTGILECLTPEFNLNVYPSPADKFIKIGFTNADADQYEYSIYAMDGRFIMSFSFTTNEKILDVSKLGQGNYILQLSKNNTLLSSKKFMILH